MSTKEQPQQDDSEWRFVPSHDVGGKAVPEYWENDNGDRHYGDIPPRPTPSPSLPDEGATTRVDHVVFSAGSVRLPPTRLSLTTGKNAAPTAVTFKKP